MRRRVHPLQYVVVVATEASTASTSTAVMSSRSPYRGGRNQQQRSFSDRSYSGGRGNYVTGDSHFQSVRESNLGYRQGDSGGFANRGGYQSPSFVARPSRPPHQNQSQQFRPSTANNPTQHLRHYPPFDQNQARRLRPQFRPRPPDYRNWECAKMAPPPASERFTILSYNILADYLATNHRSKLYYHIPPYMMDWEWRKKKIFFELGLWSPDIMCFQEVDRFKDLEEEFRVRGYNGIWKCEYKDEVVSKASDANPPVPVQPTTRWGADPLQMKVGPITRAQAKKFKYNIAAFIQEIINQEGLSRSKEPRPVLHKQTEEAKMGPGDVFNTNLDIGLNELDPHLFGIN